MANPSRAIIIVAHEVPKESWAIWSKEVSDFWEIAPGMWLGHGSRPWRCENTRHPNSPFVSEVLLASPSYKVGKIQKKPFHKMEIVHPGCTSEQNQRAWVSCMSKEPRTQCYPTGFTSTPFPCLCMWSYVGRMDSVWLVEKKGKKSEAGLHMGCLSLWVEVKNGWQLHYSHNEGWPWRTVKGKTFQ